MGSSAERILLLTRALGEVALMMSRDLMRRIQRLEEEKALRHDVDDPGEAFHQLMEGTFGDKPELLERESVKHMEKRLDIEL